MKTRAPTLCLVLLLAGLCTADPGGEDPGQVAPAKPAAKAVVALDDSFRIPQAPGKGISHTPAVVFTKDGKRMVTATSDGQIVVFDVATRKVLQKLRLPEKGTDGVAIDASGQFAVWSLESGGLAVLRIGTGKIVAKDPKLTVKWIAIAPDATRIAVTSAKSVEIRHLATLKLVDEAVPAAAEVSNVVWSPDGRLLGITTLGGHFVVHDVAKGRSVYESKKAVAQYAIAFSPDSRRVAYGGADNKVRQVDLGAEKEEVISNGQPFWITCLGYSPDGKRIAVGDESCDIWLYEVETKKRIFHNKHHVECWLNGVAWAADNETFVFGCRPNSHAGRPHLHLPLTRAEAARSLVVRESRKRLLAAIDATIETTRDEKEKAQLVSYRTALAAEERVVAYGGALSLSGGIGVGGGSGASFGGSMAESSGGEGGGEGGEGDGVEGGADGAISRVPLPALPESIRKLAEAHGKTVQDEMKKLQKDFCVNQWKAR